ncbi:TRAP transporter small permease subunit [Prochlorococcus sp. MIT 1300]|uniref:TRAP transporter small permease subunit n=1 Tax=Prochlorococcus sp. MIT 1300 TaxID=3096218 RepID=UPI002A76582D|nr:TRAP transporter small permease subunit [Prochlorococcus sp. MIT 1300]
MKRWIDLATRIDNINKAAAKVAQLAVLLMLSLGLWNVVGRYLGVAIGNNLSSNGLIEGQWYFFDLIFLLGMGWTLQRQGHVRVDVLQSYWGGRQRERNELFGTLFLLLPFAIAVMALSIEPALLSIAINEASPDPNGLPRYLVKVFIPLGFFLLVLQGIAEAIRSYTKVQGQSKTDERRHKT